LCFPVLTIALRPEKLRAEKIKSLNSINQKALSDENFSRKTRKLRSTQRN